MSIDILQEKIRKLKNPGILELGFSTTAIPASFCENVSDAEALGNYCKSLLSDLKGNIAAIRVNFSAFMLYGPEGCFQLQSLLRQGRELGYYILLDAPEILSVDAAKRIADTLLSPESDYVCDGVVISGYLGTDVIKPFLPYCKKEKKSVFVVARTANKSAAELQDLLSGSRLVHAAAADYVNRCGAGTEGKLGYKQLGLLVSATAADSLRSLRGKYPGVFLLVDGYDYPGANAKNCANAFDKYGHGAAVCAGSSITGAWNTAENAREDPSAQARNAIERMKKNLSRYIQIL